MRFLKWLFGRKEQPVELPPEFLQTAAPDWLIDLKVLRASSSARFSIRVQIFENTRKGTVDIFVLPHEQGGQPRSATVELERTDLDRLLVVLGFSFPKDFGTVSGGEGMPVTMAIHRLEPYTVAAAALNLAGWLDSRKPGPPVVEIGRILIGLQRRVMPDC